MSSDKMIFIVNGKPRAGKDTFAQILNEYMDVYKYSSVTKVKEIAKQCGWTGAKEEKDRKFLHELKMLTSAYSDMSYNDVLEEIDKFKKGELDADIIFEIFKSTIVLNNKIIFIIFNICISSIRCDTWYSVVFDKDSKCFCSFYKSVDFFWFSNIYYENISI